jgi:ATP-dependent protease HslVU (ClpYQ) peptidase subunit
VAITKVELAMSTVAISRKNGQVAMACDTLWKQGATNCPSSHKKNHSKMVRIGNALVGCVGSSAHVMVLTSLSTHHPDLFDFSSVGGIFESFRKIHKVMVDEYYLVTRENVDEQPYE